MGRITTFLAAKIHRAIARIVRAVVGSIVFPQAVLIRLRIERHFDRQEALVARVRAHQRAVGTDVATDDLFSRAITYTAVGELCLARGQLPDAIGVLERSLLLCEIVPIFFPWTAACLGYVHALSGHLADALPLIERAAANDRVQRDGTPQVASQTKIHTASGTGSVLVLARLGEGCLLAGRMDEALHWAHETLALSSELKQRGTEACALRLLGEIASHRAPPQVEIAERHYRQGLALAVELSMRPLVAHCHLGLGKLYRRTGQREQAQEHLTTATTMYREMGMTYWLEQVEAENATASG